MKPKEVCVGQVVTIRPGLGRLVGNATVLRHYNGNDWRLRGVDKWGTPDEQVYWYDFFSLVEEADC